MRASYVIFIESKYRKFYFQRRPPIVKPFRKNCVQTNCKIAPDSCIAKK